MFQLIRDKEKYSTEFLGIDNPEAEFNVFNKGIAYYNNGRIWEYGGWFVSENDSISLSENLNTFETRKVHESKDDPIAVWFAEVKSIRTGETKIERYESSKFVRMILAGMMGGSTYPEFDKCKKINYWLGRRYVEGTNEEELYFNVTTSHQLREIADYYDLPYPVSGSMSNIIDNDRTAIRYQSADLLQRGEGNFVEILLAGITFLDKKPHMLKFYCTTRKDSPLEKL